MNFVSEMDDDVGAMLDWPDQIGACHRVVDDERQPMAMGNLGDSGNIDESTARIGQAFDENSPSAVVYLAFDLVQVRRIRPAHLPIEILERMAELVDRTTIKFVGCNEIVAGLHDGMKDQKLGAMT